MNETDMLARLRAEVPFEEISPEAERRFLAGLERAAAGSGSVRRTGVRWPRGRRSHLAGRLALTGGLSLAVATVMAAPRHGGAAGAGTTEVRELAYRAAAAAGRQPQVRPGQWVYWKETASNARPRTFEVWTTADPTKAAFVAHGKVYPLKFLVPAGPQYIGQPEGLVPPGGGTAFTAKTGTIPVPYAKLGALPRNPGALNRYLANLKIPHLSGWGPPADREFLFIEEMITSYVMPPHLTAELYRALGSIPGVSVDHHAVDAAGRHGIGFVSPALVGGGREEIIINPRTFRLMGTSGLGPDHKPLGGTAILRLALVSGPGVQP